MATVDTHLWDETVCNMMACQHPPCWETLWRIENGHPRIVPRALDSPRRQSPEYEEELPTLKIVDLPLDYSQRESIKCNESLASLSKTISSIREARRYLSNSTLDEALIPRTSVLSSEKNPFPGLNSRMESHTPHLTAVSFWRPAEKIQVADLGAFAADGLDFPSACANLVFRWVPDRRPRHLQLEKSHARAAMSAERMCVKELALEGILSCKDNQKVRAKKSNKVPTGGQPYLLHLKKSQQLPAHKANPGGKGGHSTENSARQKPPSPCQLHLAPVTSLPKEAIQAPEAGRALPESKEKFLPSLLVQKAPSLYTFGAKVPAKEKGARRPPSQIRAPFGGLGLGRCPMPASAEPLNGADPWDHGGGGRPRRAQNLPLEAASDSRTLRAAPTAAFPQSPEESRLRVPPPGGPPRRKRSVRFVEYKSNTARLYMGGCDGFAPRLSRTESQYNQYCQHLASRKEDTPLAPREPPAVNQEPWPTEAAQEPEGGPLPELPSPPGHPPPPPPSPLISENSDHPLSY